MPVDTAVETTEWTTTPEVTTEPLTESATTESPTTTLLPDEVESDTAHSAEEDATTTVHWPEEENQPQSSHNIEIRWNPHQLLSPEDSTVKSVDRMFLTDWPKIKATTPLITTEMAADSGQESGTTEFRPSDEADNETSTSPVDPETPSSLSEESVSEESTKIETDAPNPTSPLPATSEDDPGFRQEVAKFSSSRLSLLRSSSPLAKPREGATGRKIEGFLNFPPRILPSSGQKENYPKIVRFNGLNRPTFRQPAVPSSPQWLYGPIKGNCPQFPSNQIHSCPLASTNLKINCCSVFLTDVRKTLDNYRYSSTQKWLELSKKRADEPQATHDAITQPSTELTEPSLASSSVEITTEVAVTTLPSSVLTTETTAASTSAASSHQPTPEVNYATPESVYGTPESVHGTPESVHGTPESVYGIPEQAQNTAATPRKADAHPATTEATTELARRLHSPPLDGSTVEADLIQQFGDALEPTGETAKAQFQSGEQHNVKQSAHWSLDVGDEEDPAATFDQQLDQSPPDGDSEDSEENQDMFISDHDAHKYLVEEKTPDGYIVGEFGIVSRSSGNLRGVRYTAHGSINPQLIQDALRTFLSL